MNYLRLRAELKDFTVFSLAEVRKVDPGFHRRRLNEWQGKGYLKKIVKGYYIFSDLEIEEPRLFEIANRIYAPSYVSFETALSHYNLIPEAVYGITSASTRRTYRFETPLGGFKYRSLRPELFFGHDLVKYHDKCFKIASSEKAILDYFYLHPHLKQRRDFESLRLNRDAFLERVNPEKLLNLLEKFPQKTLRMRVRSLLKWFKR